VPLNIVLSAIVLIVVLALVLPKLIGGGTPESANAPSGTTAEAAAPATDKLDPGPYRQQITLIEQRLYREQPGGIDDAGHIAGLVRDLSLAVRGDGRNLTRLRAWGELFDFAGEADAQADVGYTTANLPQLRGRWEEVRGQVFAPADWFKGSSVTLTRSQTRTPPVASPSTTRELRYLATQLETLVRTGRREALAIPEAGVDAALNSSEARNAEQRWREWSTRWLERLDNLARYMPANPGPNEDVNVSLAHQELSRAIGELRVVTQTAASTTTIPFKYEREQRFDSASRYLESARTFLAKLGA
jgi:hypothetical protein